MPTARGGGFAVAFVTLLLLVAGNIAGLVPAKFLLAMAPAATLIATVGYIDDVIDVSVKWRLVVHLLASCWVVACLGPPTRVPFWWGEIPISGLGVFLSFPNLA